jgi:hypothetical protein
MYPANRLAAAREEISPTCMSTLSVEAVKFSRMDSGPKIDSSRRSLGT